MEIESWKNSKLQNNVQPTVPTKDKVNNRLQIGYLLTKWYGNDC